MTSTMGCTAGQTVAAEICTMFRIELRTRWGRGGGRRRGRPVFDQAAIIADLRDVVVLLRGCESVERTAALDPARTALDAWGKFVEGYRIDGVLRFQIMDLPPYRFAAFLGEMVDSGATNMGEFETWFSARAREANARRA